MSERYTYPLLFGLLAFSIVLRSPLLFLLDVLLALVVGASALWGRYCLSGVRYARWFSLERLSFGEEMDLWIEIVNAKPLPLAWLKAEDDFPSEFTVHRHELLYSSRPRRRTLTNLLSLRWYERVRRHYRLTAERRGAFEFGPVVLSSGDIFGFRTQTLEVNQRDTILVYPKIVPLEQLGLRAARPLGDFSAERRITADPLRLAGTREYQPGDSIRHIHWKATARRGSLQTKVFDPSAFQQLTIFLNSQTLPRAHEGVVSDYFETAIVAAASIACAGLDARYPVGLFTNGGVINAESRARLPASRHRDQQTRILEALAQLTFFTFLSFEDLLRVEMPRLPYGATIIAVSALVTEPILSALLDLQARAHPVALIVTGQQPALPPPPELAVYVVAKNWTELESLELTKNESVGLPSREAVLRHPSREAV